MHKGSLSYLSQSTISQEWSQRYDNNKISKSDGKVSLMLWLWKVGLMCHIVDHCKITEKLFWFFAHWFQRRFSHCFSLFSGSQWLIGTARNIFSHFFCLVAGVVFIFSIYFSLLSFSRWLIGKTCSYFLFQRLAEGSSWLASGRQSAFSYISLFFSLLFAFLFHLIKCFA